MFLDDAGQWTTRFERAAVARDKRGGEILLERARAEAFRVIDPFLVAVTEDDDGRVEPVSLREKIRVSDLTFDAIAADAHADTHFYRYDYDRTLVGERVEQFRDQVRRRIAGELTEEQFKPLVLDNGLYLQLHAYMLHRHSLRHAVVAPAAPACRHLRASTTAATAISRPATQLDQARGRA